MHYQIHNGARDVQTRTARAQRATHEGLHQYVMNGTRRLLRGRPIVVTEDQLKQHIVELRKKHLEGVLFVTRTDGTKVNLMDNTFPAVLAAPPANPTPEPPLDSADNDKPTGLPMNPHRGEAPPPADFSMPVAAPIAATENPAEIPEPPAEPPLAPAEASGTVESDVPPTSTPEMVPPAVDQIPDAASTVQEVTDAQAKAAEESAAGTQVTEPSTDPEVPATDDSRAAKKAAKKAAEEAAKAAKKNG